jgi:hypothetical protein
MQVIGMVEEVISDRVTMCQDRAKEKEMNLIKWRFGGGESDGATWGGEGIWKIKCLTETRFKSHMR